MKIAHLSDIHIRFASRHDEYREVFNRLYEDLKKQKPKRIVITGDLNHLKVNMSPGSIDLSSEFLINLAKIAPTDIILGNHDVNLQQKEQGDTITPIFKIADRFSELISTEKTGKKAFIIDKHNSTSINYDKKGIYFFPDSGFYKISDTLVYGVYSCKDNKILTLDKKDPNVKYVALYHGQLKGAKGDNGYELVGDNLLNMSTFNNFDVVMLGDIHEHQSFRDDESMAYAGDLIQQDYGESVNKGYLMWDLETNSFQRRYILNDYGFAKITISKGELIEERIENIKFSNDKRKTKVYIVWEDFEENYSIEKEAQIGKLIKQKYGCEVVKVDFQEIQKTQQDNNDVADSRNSETYLEQIETYLKETNPDEENDTIQDVLLLAQQIDKDLEICDKIELVKYWDVDCIEISNIFSFPEKPIIINLSEMRGSAGIFGKNYSGKSNVVKAIVWGLYQHILGGGNAKKLINIYTPSNKGYVKINLSIEGEKYFIKREIITKVDKKGESSNSYPIEYKKLIINESGNEIWVDEISDTKANLKVEVKQLILNAIGTVEDFTKVCLQTQGGKEDFINQDQQPKNDLVNKYLGLELFRDRYDYGNKTFNDVKKKQKELGDIVSLQAKVLEIETNISIMEKEYNILVEEKNKSEKEKEIIDEKIIDISKSLKQYVSFLNGETDNEQFITESINSNRLQIEEDNKTLETLSNWVSVNFKKELPFDENESVESLSFQLNTENNKFIKDKNSYIEVENWIKANPPRQLFSIDGVEENIQSINIEIASLKAKLPTFKGEKCPTCGHITAEPNVEMYNKCLNDISEKTGLLNSYINTLNKHREDANHNKNCEIQGSNLQALKMSLTATKGVKDVLTQKISLISQSQDIIKHNVLVENNNKQLQSLKNSIDYKHKAIEKLNSNLEKIKINKEYKSHNINLENELSDLQEQSKAYKFSIYGLSQQINNKNGDIRVEKNNLGNYNDKLIEVKSAEKIYKKYSLYLQAVHRDGIPAKIIRRKLPIINNKINSILSTIVNFKIEMSVNMKGDVMEEFYFSSDKSDMLPLAFASGAQKFISSVVIKDALHYMSNLIKPSLNIIDEGFGTLDDELISGIIIVLNYLKNKYKNVIIITHRNEIKDSVNHIIEAYKTFDNIPQEIIDANEYAGITQINIS
jgi:DNA repair exonuclease SbcCD ATPase subunit